MKAFAVVLFGTILFVQHVLGRRLDDIEDEEYYPYLKDNLNDEFWETEYENPSEVTESPTNGITESLTEGTTESPTNGITESLTEGTTESPTNGITESLTEGTTESPPTNGITESLTEGTTESPPTNGIAESLTEGTTESPPTNGITEVTPATITEAANEEAIQEVMKAPKHAASANKEAKWFFKKDFSEWLEGKIHAGSEVVIVYHGSRLPGRDKRYGYRAWDIYAEFKFNDGGEVHQQKLDGPEIIAGEEIMDTRIFIPFGTNKITIWFKHWGYYSGYSYDSDYGKNYEEAVYPPTENSIEFKKDWSEIVHGRLEKGGKFKVFYSQERLGSANVSAVAKFSEKSELYTHDLVGPEGNYLVTNYAIPDDAEEVIMWFYTGEGDDRKYDSDYGRNYKFPLSA